MNKLLWYKCQHYMDHFSKHIVQHFGSEHITQYIHAMRAGHFTKFINKRENEYYNLFDWF